MADASSGGGGGRRGAPPSSNSPYATNRSPSAPESLDGGLLLRMLQNPPPRPQQQQTLDEPHNFFVDPAVAAVGPFFSSPPHVHGGGFAWPSSSDPQPQLRFSDPRFPQPLDLYAERGRGGFRSADGVARNRAEKPRSGAPPPGFGKPSPPGFGTASAAGREVPDLLGAMQQRREPNHHHPKGFDRRHTSEHQMMPPFTGGQGVLGRLPHVEQHTSPITSGRGAAAGMMYREQQQQQDHILSRTPPDANVHGFIGRVPHGEQHMTQFAGRGTLLGEQHIHPATGGSIMQRGQRQQQPCSPNMPQGDQRWQGHTSRKLPTGNELEMLGKMPMKQNHQASACSSVDMDVQGDRGKKILAEATGLEDGVGEVGHGHVVHGRPVVHTRNSEVSYQNSEVRFAAKKEEEDGSKEEDAIIEQFMDTVVIDGNGEAKGVVVQNSGSRSKDFRSDFSRGHHVSSQRVRFQRRIRPCRYDIDQFTPNFLSVFESLVPSEEEIAKQEQLLITLGRLINKEWPNSKLYLYGSCANSFGFSNSDVDLCLAIDDKEMSKVDFILKLAEILQAGNLQNIQALTRARVPIVKLMDQDTGLSCDICVNNLLAVVNTKLLRDYAQIDRRLRQLAFIVKHWAKSRRVNETYQGTLSSYAYVIMCIHLLQLRRILPCLQEMDATCNVTVDDNHCAYFDKVDKLQNYGAQNKESVSSLLWAFFHYWAYQHDYMQDVISIRTGRIIRYIQENYSKIRDVEKELENLTLEVKLTSGPKKAALEHLRKKIEMSTERIRLAKVKEDEAKKAWEAAAQVVKEEEDAKQRLCDDLNSLVQESAASQYSRLEELKKRLECLNPVRASVDVCATTNPVPQQPTSQNPGSAAAPASNAHEPASIEQQQQRPAEAEKKRRPSNAGGRGRGGVMALPKGRGSSGSGWTGAGFET